MQAPGSSSDAPAISIDAALVTRAAGGDARAFRSLYERHSRALFRFLCDQLRDSSAAEEALQETFVRAHARLSTLHDPDRVRAWLFGIARLVAMEARRARAGEAGEGVLDELPMPGPSPEISLLGREAARALDLALADLRPDRREALLMTADHELPYSDIAENLGWSLAKVKVEIHRARRELRTRLSKYLGGKS
jgi:RNA polymerase sigma-70 factor (ECF subfamily)